MFILEHEDFGEHSMHLQNTYTRRNQSILVLDVAIWFMQNITRIRRNKHLWAHVAVCSEGNDVVDKLGSKPLLVGLLCKIINDIQVQQTMTEIRA